MARKGETRTDGVNAILHTLEDFMPPATRECYFYPGRQWRFDIAWPERKVAVEYEGNTWVAGGSRHNTGIGYRLDVEKYNAAAVQGWCVIRVTSDMLRDLTYIRPILLAWELRGSEPEEVGVNGNIPC